MSSPRDREKRRFDAAARVAKHSSFSGRNADSGVVTATDHGSTADGKSELMVDLKRLIGAVVYLNKVRIC